MDEDTRLVMAIVGIATEMLALINHHTREARLAKSLRRDEARKTCADDQKINGISSGHARKKRRRNFSYAAALGRMPHFVAKPSEEFWSGMVDFPCK
jgi:hypothetical protein